MRTNCRFLLSSLRLESHVDRKFEASLVCSSKDWNSEPALAVGGVGGQSVFTYEFVGKILPSLQDVITILM